MKKNGMKKLAAIVLCMLLVMTLVPAISVSAAPVGYTFTEGGITYKITEEPPPLQGGVVKPVGKVSVVGLASDNEDDVIEIPSTVSLRYLLDGGIISNYRVTSIEADAFGLNQDITKVVLSNTIETIGENAFRSCTELSEVVFPDSLTSIAPSAFLDCNKLNEIYINAPHLSSIGDSAFAGQTTLTKATILSSVENISVGEYVFGGEAVGNTLTVYSNNTALLQEAAEDGHVTVKQIELDSYRFRDSYVSGGNEYQYKGTAYAFDVNMILENAEGSDAEELSASDYTVTYLRNGTETTDLTSVGEIEIRVSGASGSYGGSHSFFVTILPAPLTIIARDKALADEVSIEGMPVDVYCIGLVSGEELTGLTLTADGDALVPSDAIIKRGAVSVDSNYDITYVNGRSFTEKSIESFEKTTEGNVDTYTIVFGDGTTETLVITNGVDGEDGQDGAAGAQGPQGEKGEKGDKGDTGAIGADGASSADSSGGDSTLVYVSMGIGGVSLAGMIALLFVVLKKKKV